MVDENAELRTLRVQENSRYVSTPANDHLKLRIQEFWEHAQDCLAGGGSRRRLFAVIGESGTGKSTAILQVLKSVAAFQRYKNEYNEEKIPVVSFELDSASTTKGLAIHLLEKLGQTATAKATEDALYSELKNQLRESGTVLVHLDEAQHLLKGGGDAAVRGLQDRFKSLLSISDWPLHLLVSGVEDLSHLFTGDQQLANRSLVMRFDTLLAPGDNPFVKEILVDIAVTHCGLQLDSALTTDDFLGRLVKATGGGAGTMIEMLRSASFKALSKGHHCLQPKDFEFVYSRTSGSRIADNIMSASAWRDLDRRNALIDFHQSPDKGKRSSKKVAK